ncbi:MAG: ABC transporter permease subunit [Clostridium sp.]|nr:ABC transporter permease subunit [Clostridium sp.]
MELRKRWLERLGWIVLFLALWEGSVKAFHVSRLLFPPVEEVAETLYQGMVHGDLIWQSLYSVGIIGASLAVSAALAVVLALLSTWSNIFESLIDTLTSLAHPLPGLALLPLIIMWFGTGSGAVAAIVVHSALWPVLVNLLSGFKSMPSIYGDIGRSLSMNTVEITLEIRLRASLAHLISGLKIGWARGWRAFISAEMVFGAVGAKGGIGWYILTQRTFMNTAGLFAGIILVIIIGIAVEDVLFASLERHTLVRWGMKMNERSEGQCWKSGIFPKGFIYPKGKTRS